MKRTKKILLMFVAIFALSTTAQAIEISLGGSVALGVAFFRGKDAKDFTSMLENISEDRNSFGISYMPKIDLLVEVLPFLAIETGVGWDTTSISYGNHSEFFGSVGSPSRVEFYKIQVSVPIMLRGQYEYKLGVTYVAVGVKLGFQPLTGPYMDVSANSTLGLDSYEIKNSDFAMDVSFAIGQEFRIGDANYLGIRVGYDLNVIQNFDTKDFKDAGLEAYTSHFMDDVEFAITYRYAFGSKWKK